MNEIDFVFLNNCFSFLREISYKCGFLFGIAFAFLVYIIINALVDFIKSKRKK